MARKPMPRPPEAAPILIVDDFQILVRSWTWRAACDNLWVPANEHAMPLGRLTTWALAALAGPAADVPHVLLWQGPLAVVLGMVLVGAFVRRELGVEAFATRCRLQGKLKGLVGLTGRQDMVLAAAHAQ